MDATFLVKLLGFPATLMFGDCLVWDRWRWLSKRLPLTNNKETLLDVGCGSGAFTIGAALRGYHATGMSWDEQNQTKASQRAELCKAHNAHFEIGDARDMHNITHYKEKFDVVICLETIEHIINDKKLINDISQSLKPGGRMLLTTPNYYYVPISRGDWGPFLTEETGWHVRRGYNRNMLIELVKNSGLTTQEISHCSGFWSQKLTSAWRSLNSISSKVSFIITNPLKPVAILLDIATFSHIWWPQYSICIEATKPRYHDH